MYKVNDKGQVILTDGLKTLLKRVQSQGNLDIKYQEDKKTYKKEEYWAYPKEENNKLVGDCEDYSLYKRKLLLDAGVPAGCMMLTICIAPGGGGHCVLTVATDISDYILCNAHDGLTSPNKMKREGWVFKYRQQMNGLLTDLWDVVS